MLGSRYRSRDLQSLIDQLVYLQSVSTFKYDLKDSKQNEFLKKDEDNNAEESNEFNKLDESNLTKKEVDLDSNKLLVSLERNMESSMSNNQSIKCKQMDLIDSEDRMGLKLKQENIKLFSFYKGVDMLDILNIVEESKIENKKGGLSYVDVEYVNDKKWYEVLTVYHMLSGIYGSRLNVKGSPHWKTKGGRSLKLPIIKIPGGGNSFSKVTLESRRGCFSLSYSQLGRVRVRYNTRKK